MSKFIGRKQELSDLSNLLNKKSGSLIVITGRRRVGKSRLVNEFAKSHQFLKFSGLPPSSETTAQDQRNTFSKQLNEQTKLPYLEVPDWSTLFSMVAHKIQTMPNKPIIVLFDEISWMGSQDNTFLGKLKIAWDEEFSTNQNVIMILCGSISTWIEENILSSTGFFGRISRQIHLDPLSLAEANQMLQAQGFKHSTYEKFRILAVTGCIPWYLENVQGQKNSDDNINELCFRRGAILVQEYNRIFHDLFEKRGDLYKRIAEALVNGALNFEDLCQKIDYNSSGTMTKYLYDMTEAGFINKSKSWSLKTSKMSKYVRYRLSDNYIRFYLKYIEPRLDKIAIDAFKDNDISQFSAWETIMGLQFENLILNNRLTILKALNIKPDSVVHDGPFIQRANIKQEGLQIDYLIQTKFNTLYVCEIKFSRQMLSKKIIKEVQTKIDKLKLPHGFACLPVVISVNGIDEAVVHEGYFYSSLTLEDLI